MIAIWHRSTGRSCPQRRLEGCRFTTGSAADEREYRRKGTIEPRGVVKAEEDLFHGGPLGWGSKFLKTQSR